MLYCGIKRRKHLTAKSLCFTSFTCTLTASWKLGDYELFTSVVASSMWFVGVTMTFELLLLQGLDKNQDNDERGLHHRAAV
jgi:hypothetical protein